MKKLFYLLLLIGLISISFTRDNTENAKNDNVYTAGEYLKFEAGYGWIVGGVAELTLESKKFRGKDVYYAKGSAKTVGIADALYKVHDTYESYFDPRSGLPVYAIEDQKEGPRYRYHIELDFLHEQNLVKSSKKVDPDSIPHRTFDILSAFYQLRNSIKTTIKPGQQVKLHTYFQGKNWDLIVRFTGYETVNLGFGKVECYKFLPVVQKGDVFTDEDALSIWVSKDEAKIPVKVEFDLMVGSFKAELVDYKGLKYPINVKSK